MGLSRRQLLTFAGVGTTGAILTASLKAFYTREALRLRPVDSLIAEARYLLSNAEFGRLRRDPRGLLDLPEGFRYSVFSQAGDVTDDGRSIPGAHDGMGAFADESGNIVLVRNHELSPSASIGAIATPELQYDTRAKGGTTTVILTPDRQLLKHEISLAGTVRNCGGGTTPWGTWISCEEDVSTPQTNPEGDSEQVLKPHGYNFEVQPLLRELTPPEPLVAMGRFRHEAIAVDPRTGILYQTEDQVDGLFYRFIPQQPGNLKAGGTLEALRIKDRPQAITHTDFPVGEPMAVEWVRIEDVDPEGDTVRVEGFTKGAAQFTRGEGMCYSDGQIYFTCTNGGNVPHGQIWRYRPGLTPEESGTIELFIQPNNPRRLDFPDNITMAPWGDLMVCEDGDGEQFIIGITPAGELYRFARNALNSAEFAGICFAPDGKTMFVNVYSPGMTFAIWSER